MKKKRKFFNYLTVLSTVVWSWGGWSTVMASDDFQIENDFLKSLNEASEIVSQKKLNIDKVPSTVTVVRRHCWMF